MLKVLVVAAGLVEIHSESLEFHGRNAASDANVETSGTEMIEHAELFKQPQRVIERKEIKQSPEPDSSGLPRGCSEKNAGRRRHRERRRVMLREVIAIETGSFRRLQQG